MRVLLVLPRKPAQVKDIPGSLTNMQELVGGCIQAVYPFDESVALVCNDEGKLLNLPPNRFLRDPATGIIYDYIAGPFFLCAAPPDSENFVSLSEEQLARYSDYYNHPATMI